MALPAIAVLFVSRKGENISIGRIERLADRLMRKPGEGGKAGRAKSYVLNMLLDCDIAAIKLTDFPTSHDLSYLSSVLATARLIFGIDYTGLYPKSLHDKFNLLNGADSGQ
jgi:hypothetical protein